MKRIYLNVEDSLFNVLQKEAVERKTSISNMIVGRLCEDFLSEKTADFDCLKLLIDDALRFESNNEYGEPFTITNLEALSKTELLEKKEYKRSTQRPAVAKAFNAVVRKGQLPGIACLVEVKKDGSVAAVKTNRNSTYILIKDRIVWKANEPHYVMYDENNKLIAYTPDDQNEQM